MEGGQTMKIWKWIKAWKWLVIVQVILWSPPIVWAISIPWRTPTTSYTTRADCSRAMELNERNLSKAKQETQDWENNYKELALNYKQIARGICFKIKEEEK